MHSPWGDLPHEALAHTLSGLMRLRLAPAIYVLLGPMGPQPKATVP